MTALYLSDSGTPIISRAVGLLEAGVIRGVLLSPFTTPLVPDLTSRSGRARQHASRCVAEIQDAAGNVLFDMQTHAVDFPGANSFTRYNTWDLWAGQRGDLSSPSLRQGHIDRVITEQSALGLDVLGPTTRIDQPASMQAQLAIDLAQRTLQVEPNAWLTIAGSSSFWASGNALDTHVGAIAQLRPAGFVLVVARPAMGYPAPGLTAEEVEGLCRTVYSLQMRRPVIVSHGDLAALPTVAAGASGLGSGWDLRQRVLGADAFQTATTMRRRGSRITHRGLLAVLKRREAETLRVRDRALSSSLVPGDLPVGQVAEWEDHLNTLQIVTDQLSIQPAGRARVDVLRELYSAAEGNFHTVEALVGRLAFGSRAWLNAVSTGLENYAVAEGW